LVVVIFISTVKKTVSRVLVLVVSMGIGVVKWTLGATRIKITVLALLYFVSSLILDILEKITTTSSTKISKNLISTFVIPVAILDTAFYWWIFLSLIRTIQQVTLRRQVLKLQMYRRFFGVLLASLVFSVVVILYQLFSVMMGKDSWRTQWMWEAFWHLLYFIILTAIAFLWRPRQNNTRYGYAEFYDATEDSPENSVPLEVVTTGAVKMRKLSGGNDEDEAEKKNVNKNSYESERERNIKEASQVQLFDKAIASFVLEDDEEDNTAEKELNKME